MNPAEHDELCAWISHVPQMISTAVASTLVEEYGNNAPLLETGGRALREMTRTASSPYSMWRDVALTNKEHIANALLKLEQKLAQIRESLDSRGLEQEFEQAHLLKSHSQPRHPSTTLGAGSVTKKNAGRKLRLAYPSHSQYFPFLMGV